MDFDVPSWYPQHSEDVRLSVFYFQQTLAPIFISISVCSLHKVKGLDAFSVKTLQILMVSSFLSAPHSKTYFLSGSSFLQAIGYSWLLENRLDYSSFFPLFTSKSLLPILTTKTISKLWVTQSRSVHRGFLGIYPSSHVLKDWISWIMHMQAPLILCCFWQNFLTKAVVAFLNKDYTPRDFILAIHLFLSWVFLIASIRLNLFLNFFTFCSLLAALFIPKSHSLGTSLHALSHINSLLRVKI